MNDDYTDLEDDLRRLEPRPPSPDLERRIAAELEAPRQPAQLPGWWRRLGFSRPTAAIGWGLVSPVAAAAVAVVCTLALEQRHPPAPPLEVRHAASTVSDLGNPLAGLAASREEAKATNVVYQTLDEGVVLDGAKEPVRRVRYRSADLVQWNNPRTGAQLEVSYPREDVLLLPIQAD